MFIILTTFTTLNLLFGIIVDAMNKTREEEENSDRALASASDDPAKVAAAKLAAMEGELREVRKLLEKST